ncbi:MAG: alpha/beta hydrolase [Clostridiales bacterium]|nr:alpha/beta hydrolase [Clostridiales bacterium]
MNYAVFGTGEKVFVMLPGLSVHRVTASAQAVADAYSMFAKDFTVYVFDPPENIREGYTLRDVAEDTAAAMTALGIENADVFGVSMGGMIAMHLAADHPELVGKVILGSTLARQNDTFSALIAEWTDMAERRDETALLESFAARVYSGATLAAYHDFIIDANRGIGEEEYARFLILARACGDFDCMSSLSRVSCPVLVLGSGGDQAVTPEGSEEIAEALGCEIYMYDDCYGHAVYDEAPDYKQRIMDFFMN